MHDDFANGTPGSVLLSRHCVRSATIQHGDANCSACYPNVRVNVLSVRHPIKRFAVVSEISRASCWHAESDVSQFASCQQKHERLYVQAIELLCDKQHCLTLLY